jgi:ferritin-like metal-binding protein YciE
VLASAVYITSLAAFPYASIFLLARLALCVQQSKGESCEGMEGLIEEGCEIMEEDLEPDAIDAGLISAAQRVEHYEIAAYGLLRTRANILGDKQTVSLLQETLDEEKETDQKLTQMAERVNVKAADASAR